MIFISTISVLMIGKILAEGPLHNPYAYDPDCPTCNRNASELVNGYGSNESFDPSIHRGDKGLGHVVFTTDALHHGNGILMSVSGKDDILRKKPNEQTLDKVMKNAENEAAKAEIKVKIKEKELKEIEKDIAEKESHRLMHEREMLQEEKKRIENLKLKNPEILAKNSIPVVVFDSHGFPYAHHLKMILSKVNQIRNVNRALIDSQQKIAKLDDITDKMARLNPGTKNPIDYKNVLDLTGANNLVFNIPVSPSNGNFYISDTSKNGTDHINHPIDSPAHSNLPMSDLYKLPPPTHIEPPIRLFS